MAKSPYRLISRKIKRALLEYHILRMRDRLIRLTMRGDALSQAKAALLLARLEKDIARLTEVEKMIGSAPA